MAARRSKGLTPEQKEDPVAFVRGALGEEPYPKQEEILGAIRRSRRVSVVGCNGSGKDWATARAILWWMNVRSPAKAVVTGPTTRQVDEIVWNEMRWAFSSAPVRLKGKMFRTSKYNIDGQSFAIGFATNSPYNLQGFHSPNLLVVITEAHAAREADIDAVRRLNPSHLVMTGNPFTAGGAFFDSHHSKRGQYETIQIGAYDTPNLVEELADVPGMITQQNIEDHREEWGEESALYVGSVLGQFPGQARRRPRLPDGGDAGGEAASPTVGAGDPRLRRRQVRPRQDGRRPQAGPRRAHRLEGAGLRHDGDGRLSQLLLQAAARRRARRRRDRRRRGSGRPAEGAEARLQARPPSTAARERSPPTATTTGAPRSGSQ